MGLANICNASVCDLNALLDAAGVQGRTSPSEQERENRQEWENENNSIITYVHIGFDTSITDIMTNGLRPVSGGSSGNDPRFYAITTQRGSAAYPPPTPDQATDMLNAIFIQLDLRRLRSEPGSSDFAQVVHINLPESVVSSLENLNWITYGPFLRLSERGLTESIFAVESFPTVNSYRSLWTTGNRLGF